MTFIQAMLAEASVTGIKREQRGNAGFYSAPADTFRTRDGWIVVQMIGPDMFARWARLVCREDLIADAEFATDLLRADHREVIAAAMKLWLADQSTCQALAALEAARIPAGPVMKLPEVLDDPQVKAREILQFVDYPGAPKPVPLAGPAMRLSETPGRIASGPPARRSILEEILGEMGYTDR